MNIERALETVREFTEQKSAPKDLQPSLDLLSAYTSALPRIDSSLARRVVETARTYNERVRQEELEPASVSGILRELFSKLSGKKRVRRHEIYIPTFSDKILSVLQSVQRNSDADFGAPKQVEIDLFKTKALTLLVDAGITLVEALSLIKTGSISYSLTEGAYLLQGNALHLRMHTSRLPGCEYEIQGSFQRDSFHPELVLPVTFELISHIAPTGFPAPSQYIGMPLSDILFPNLLRPKMCPKFALFLEQKRALAKDLLPTGALFTKAQAHIVRKKTQLEKLRPLIQKLPLPCELEKAEEYIKEHIEAPIHRMQDEWLLKQNSTLTADSPYTSLYLLQLSEHLNVEPHTLSPFERALFTSLFRQQLIFSHELQHGDLDPKELLEQDIALFNGTPTQDPFTQEAQELVEELLQYYPVRYETGALKLGKK